MAKNIFNDKKVGQIARLSSLTFSKKESEQFKRQFNEILDVIVGLDKIDTSKVKTTFQVTGLINVFRSDTIDKARILTQKDALSNSKNTKDGYFVVKGVFDGE